MGFRGSQPGERRGGRQKGTPNKMTSTLKDAILRAAELAGGDGDPGGLIGFLHQQATTNPGPFLTLLGKVLPHAIAGDDDAPPIQLQWDLSSLSDEELAFFIRLHAKIAPTSEEAEELEKQAEGGRSPGATAD